MSYTRLLGMSVVRITCWIISTPRYLRYMVCLQIRCWDHRKPNLTLSEDKIDLRGLLIWTPFDNLYATFSSFSSYADSICFSSEWNSATRQKFGLQHTNFSTPALNKTYKLSFFKVRDFFKEHLPK